jgi:hypothetical protein
VLGGDGALVGCHFDGAGRLVGADGKILEGRGGDLAGRIQEALDGRNFGLLDALELVALSGVDRNGDGLASGDLLEAVGREAGLLIVDIDSVERKRLASCLSC